MRSECRREQSSRVIAMLASLLIAAFLSKFAYSQEGVPAAPAPPPAADGASKTLDDVLNMDIDQLAQAPVAVASAGPSMEQAVTSVTREPSTMARSPAAVYVVTQEMIRRCGARNVPEVLRTVPGVNVARINASAWAISIRGFNARFANKLLVQIDGIPIYNPTQSGVFWEREYVMLEDIERIEVIRGPGASVWGVNAVNGIISITTKSSKDTKGIYVDGGGGNSHGHQQFGDFRAGGQSGDLTWRVYGMTMADGNGYVPPPDVAYDKPSLNQGGFRADWTPTRQDTLTITGDFYQGIDNQVGVYTPPADPTQSMDCSHTRFLTRWARKTDEQTDWAVELFYNNPYAIGPYLNSVATFGVDFQYHLDRGRHNIVWGFGYRNSDDAWAALGAISLGINDSEQIPEYFIQDTITLVDDRWFLTLGAKFDHNSITTFEFQPTARIMWTPDDKTSIWGAISRAARIPSLIERFFITPGSEDLMAYEAGMRRQPNDDFFWDVAVFANRYSHLLGYQQVFNYENVGTAQTYGFEAAANYQVNEYWQLRGSYSFLSANYQWPTGYTPAFIEGGSPRNQFYLQSGWNLTDTVSLDAMFRYVDSLPAGVASYFAGDVRLAWRPRENVEFSVVGQNLFAGKHYEFVTDSGATPTEIGPAVYGMVTWRY